MHRRIFGGAFKNNMKERLQKIISNSGLTSRRKAEELIAAGKVSVNGVTAQIGDSADINSDLIYVDGKLISAEQSKKYIMLNKPRGYVCTLKDEKGRKLITDLIDLPERLYPVGRLDINSEGLILLTNDGEFANKFMHPSKEIVKTYELKIRSEDDNIHSGISLMKKPITIDGYTTKAADVQLVERIGLDANIIVSIHEGRNRQIRRLCERSNFKVLSLKRIREGSLSLGDLKIGKWRYLTNDEIRSL